jgi:ribosomal protein L16/L10AE
MSPIKKGQLLFEINSPFLNKAFLVLRKAATKLPLKTKIIRLKF